MFLTHLGFPISFIRWIMCCISPVSFSVLINGSVSNFFDAERGLRHGCPLSPLLVLLVMEGLSKLILEERRVGWLLGPNITDQCILSHLLFVDDVLFLSSVASETSILSMISYNFFVQLLGWKPIEQSLPLASQLALLRNLYMLIKSFPSKVFNWMMNLNIWRFT